MARGIRVVTGTVNHVSHRRNRFLSRQFRALSSLNVYLDLRTEIRNSLFFALIAVLGIGCVTFLLYRSSFQFHGVVFDQATHAPIYDARIYFVDTGLDDDRSRERVPKWIGRSDGDGQIKTKFDYGYCIREGLFFPEPGDSFDIVVSKDGYRSERFSFRLRDLPRDEDFVNQVALGEVFLEPE